MFESAYLKLEWAKQHISNLEKVFTAFIDSHPHTLAIGSDPKTGEMTVDVRVREKIPDDFSLVLGDAIHNLRTTLDHAMWELIGIDGGTQHRWTSLPTGRNRRDYEAACNGIKTPRADTKKFFVELAFREDGGGSKIYALHILDNTEKHTVITPLVGVAKVAELKVVRPDGVVMITMKDCSFGMGKDGRARMMRLGAGLSIEFDNEAKPTIDVFFGDVEFFEFKPMIPTLMDLSDAVTDVLGQFTKFVTERV